MEIANLKLGSVVFPGVAGERQSQGAVASLIKELGSNYELYHEFLAGRMAELPRPAVPRAGSKDSIEEYLAGWAAVQDVVRAESILRACARFIATGALHSYQPGDVALLTPDGNGLNHKDVAAPSPRTVRDLPPLAPATTQASD